MSDPVKRVLWVDRAKALGMLLVFYGHVIEALVDEGYQSAFYQFRLIYSFHMPLFFLMAGFFFKRRYPTWLQEVKDLALRRLLPVVFFGVLTLPFWPLDLYLGFGRVRWDLIALRSYNYFLGKPDLNTITWFLVCLFTTEAIAALLLFRVRRGWTAMLLAALSFRIGLLMTSNIKEAVVSLGIARNVWYFHEAFVAFGFYALGYAVFEVLQDLDRLKPILRLSLAVLAMAVVLLTFERNQPYDGFIVIMKISEHGSTGWFLLTAFTGSALILMLSTLFPGPEILNEIGRNTLVLIGLSGLFHEFFNHILVRWLPIPDTVLGVTFGSLVITLASVILSMPVVRLVNRYLPQLAGKPNEEGPWLPSMVRFFRAAWLRVLPQGKFEENFIEITKNDNCQAIE